MAFAGVCRFVSMAAKSVKLIVGCEWQHVENSGYFLAFDAQIGIFGLKGFSEALIDEFYDVNIKAGRRGSPGLPVGRCINENRKMS